MGRTTAGGEGGYDATFWSPDGSRRTVAYTADSEFRSFTLTAEGTRAGWTVSGNRITAPR